MRIKGLLAKTGVVVGLSAFGLAIGAGAASAHDLTGGAAQATCQGHTVQVTWSFTSSNAGTHTIQSVSFDRAVTSSSFTASTVTAHTTETPGAKSLTATVVFEDGFVSKHTVTTTIPDSVCPPPPGTSVPPTTVPATTVPPSTAPPTTPQAPTTTTVVTLAPAIPPVTTTPAPPVAGTRVVKAPAPVPTTCRNDVSAEAPLGPGETVCALPATGTSPGLLVGAAAIALPLGGLLILATRRRPEAV